MTRIAQFSPTEVKLLVNDGGGFGPKELGEAGWRVVSTFVGPGPTLHGVGQYIYALWEFTAD